MQLRPAVPAPATKYRTCQMCRKVICSLGSINYSAPSQPYQPLRLPTCRRVAKPRIPVRVPAVIICIHHMGLTVLIAHNYHKTNIQFILISSSANSRYCYSIYILRRNNCHSCHVLERRNSPYHI